jgi:hypothetical protein
MAGTTIETSVPEELPDLPPDDPQPETPPADDPSVEARAREMGWKPLAEYRGPPGRWHPAADFIARGENILPIVRDQNRRMTERIGKLEGEVSGLRTTASEQLQIIKDLREMGRTAGQRGYERAMAEIKTQQRAAVERGDTASYDQLVAQAEALASERPAVAPEPPKPPTEPQRPTPPQLSQGVRDFLGANPWFNTDGLLTNTMTAFHGEVLRERGVTQAALDADVELDRELLEEAKSRVVAKYPERFGVQPPRDPAPTPPRRRAAAVAAPTPDAPARANGNALTINSIQDPTERAEAKAAFERNKRHMPDYTEAEYMALYNNPHADVLAMQLTKKAQPNGR